MRLRDAVLGSRIAWIALAFAFCELTLSGDAALQLRLHLTATALFDRIGATDFEDRDENREEERPGFHPLILGNNVLIANLPRTISNRR